MGIKRWSFVLASVVGLLIQPIHIQAARHDDAFYGGLKKSYCYIVAAVCITKCIAHSVMTKHYFHQRNILLLQQNGQQDKYSIPIPPPERWREWATTAWGTPVEYTSYTRHGLNAFAWLCAGLSSLYASRYV
jgi:hypothetical protein